ncbi:hypothetical protein ABBQ38_011277 [Trebouxia sp. C0009 RCD-2024]
MIYWTSSCKLCGTAQVSNASLLSSGVVNNALTAPGSTFSDTERAWAHTDFFQFASLLEQRLHWRAIV